MFIFWRCGLKLPIHTPFWRVLGAYFPRMTSPTVLTPKGPYVGGNTSFELFSERIGAMIRHGRVTEKNG